MQPDLRRRRVAGKNSGINRLSFIEAESKLRQRVANPRWAYLSASLSFPSPFVPATTTWHQASSAWFYETAPAALCCWVSLSCPWQSATARPTQVKNHLSPFQRGPSRSRKEPMLQRGTVVLFALLEEWATSYKCNSGSFCHEDIEWDLCCLVNVITEVCLYYLDKLDG